MRIIHDDVLTNSNLIKNPLYAIANLSPYITLLTSKILIQTIQISHISKRISVPKMRSLAIVNPIIYHVLIIHYLIVALHLNSLKDLLLINVIDVIEEEALNH